MEVTVFICKCRFCAKLYDEAKSSADYKGFCSQRCLHASAKQLGWRKGKKGQGTEYDILKRNNRIGSVIVEKRLVVRRD